MPAVAGRQLAGVILDHQVLFALDGNLGACGDVIIAGGEAAPTGIDISHSRALTTQLVEDRHRLAAWFDGDHVTGFQTLRRNGRFFAIDREMAVGHILTRGVDGRRQSGPHAA